MNIHSIKFRIVALSGLCVALATGALVGYGVYSARQTANYVLENVDGLLDRLSKDSLSRLASTEAGVIRAEVDSAFDAARAMARSFETVAEEEKHGGSPVAARRGQINDILLRVLKDNPRFNGTYSAWMDDELDGHDAEFHNRKDVGSDATGRVLPYWTRDAQGKIALQPLVEYDSRDLHPNGVMKGGWFLGPQADGKESILAPLPYIVQGKPVHLATMSVPIMIDGKFVGVAGADFDLGFIQKLAEKVNSSIYDGKGSVAIVTNAGLVVAASGKASAIGGDFAAVDDAARQYRDILKAGLAEIRVDADRDLLKVFSPVPLGRTGAAWSVIITEPRALVLAEARQLAASMTEREQKDVTLKIIAALLVAAGAVAMMTLVARGIASPIAELSEALRRLARGESLREIAGAGRKDEIGEISRAVDHIRVGAEQEATRKAAAGDADRQRQEKERRETMLRLADDFERAMGDVVQGVVAASTQLQAASASMSTATGRVAEQAQSASQAAEEASQNVRTVAAAAEQLTASISEIKRQVDESAAQTAQAANDAEATSSKVKELSESAQTIGQIVDLINNIAGQTNLLALNATIEAARAGESGRGFAVVANEVKDLATQTGRATSDIGAQINEIQRSTESSAAAIVNIASVIERTKSISATIAYSVEQQGAATEEIAVSVAEASNGTTRVSSDLVGITNAAQDSAGAASDVQAAAADLARQAETLRGVMGQFLTTVRAA
ncbi:methyl-accepting chemotaxis sensory transducer with Cache sensor [Rhodoblastus acidophilus]|uniref:Methyl-accepting chemotaxis sensory transducer with Cache sensor n=1 Tax=Rhodoblastus acidophilus TaxID=1074 RepID=A0A212QXS3_RHOAC|nr:methyl-accepting chemotaxis protein [Rhodoblastus acidophilus]PPQ40622.1 methyl-accepting chemotaxis protein [Rhodoblastus acidophilus]RAI22974.1 methyl-accepting chemotaxis protein [Rhodoblastus acidophilus]SNB64509.1 methyl-accepting chemotaxis sensory transducer with Cache sensor [Rhodoblastus acidophilus]